MNHTDSSIMPKHWHIDQKKADKVVSIFQLFHRKNLENDEFETKWKRILESRICSVKSNERIKFVLAWFPCKSKNNKTKVLWHLPDKWELLALRRLQHFTDLIKEAHNPWAEITIASDGRVFNDIVWVSDLHVDEYKSELVSLLWWESDIHILGLEDLIIWERSSDIRTTFDQNFCPPIEEVQSMIINNIHTNILYCWLKKFLHEDIGWEFINMSNSKMENILKQKAKDVIRRSIWFDRVIKSSFPDHIRLSIHPHTTSNWKFWFNLIWNQDVRWTPRHNVTVQHWEEHFLMKKREAEELWYTLQSENWKPWYFINGINV